MPSQIFTVTRIDSTATATPGLTLHLVSGVTSDELPFQVRTVNAFAASVCQRAQQLGKPVSVIWRDGRHGKQIVQVDILDQQAQVA